MIHFYKGDLPSGFLNDLEDGGSVAIDTETMGLLTYRDRLCLAQFSKGDGDAHLVKFDTQDDYSKANNIKSVLENMEVLKIFHYARFDMMTLYRYLGSMARNVYCTKIASKLVRTYTSKHSLLDLCRDLLDVEISKEQTCTDWGSISLSDQQMQYAANDVLYLHRIKAKLDEMLVRENRSDIARSCFDFLETRVKLDLMSGENYDIFSHSSC